MTRRQKDFIAECVTTDHTWFVLLCLWKFDDQDIAIDHGIIFG